MKKRKQTRSHPPAPALWIIRWLTPKENRNSILCNLEEEYDELWHARGRFAANRWTWGQVALAFFALLKFILFEHFIRPIYWRGIMFRNYLKTTIRNIQRNRGYAFLNVVSLSIGIAACVIIAMWTLYETSFDGFHPHMDRLYRVVETYRTNLNPWTPIPVGPAMKHEVPEIEQVVRYAYYDDVLVRNGERAFYEVIRAVDEVFFRIFNFPLVQGDPNLVLSQMASIVISRNMAEKYFPDEDPIGKTLTLNNADELQVSGVFEDFPSNTMFDCDFMIPMAFTKWDETYSDGWLSNNLQTFVLLQAHASLDVVNEKIRILIEKNVSQERIDEGQAPLLSLEPIREMRFSQFSGQEVRKVILTIFGLIAFLVLGIACINYMNLATARSMKRAKEIGLRKVVGASRLHLIGQFLGESFIFTLISVVFAIVIAYAMIPTMNHLIQAELQISLLGHPTILYLLALIVLLTGFVSGSYPALVLSGFSSVDVLKGAGGKRSQSALLRKVLVVAQFAVSVLLIIGTFVISKQLGFIQSKSVGYDKDQIVQIELREGTRTHYRAFRDQLKQDHRILNVSGLSGILPYFFSNTMGVDWEGKGPDEIVTVTYSFVDHDFIETLGVDLIEGRNFSMEHASDSLTSYVVNRELARIMGHESTIGTQFTQWGETGTVIGVIEDFHFMSMGNRMRPMVLWLRPHRVKTVLIRIDASNIASSLTAIKETWERLLPMYPFEYSFLGDQVDDAYTLTQRFGHLLNLLAGLAIMIACLGIFGLAAFSAERRTKEVGVRKVLGATVPNVVVDLSKEFVHYVLIANVIAWPAAYFLMNSWLNAYPYKTRLSLDLFVFAAAATFAIALLSVSYQIIKAARSNPVEALRYE